ncbi:phospholipase D family protein [Palleronia caenipelagi]|uniref:Phospholipase D n=1 Tax=Palleronia caenipelagi TaxID=2489174 RepID=A0A547QB35_9RHOB|nr:phospholipase D family protein [Palleronia caenipelagi]TRD23546.1 phospholipase D family protein [Palleronia caenipelagi]
MILKLLLLFLAAIAAAVVVLRVLFPLPDLSDRPESTALTTSADTALAQRVNSVSAEHPGKSGIIPLLNGGDALATRLALAEAAEVSIDAQYYIWHDDTSGMLLLDSLWRAAERGVRVRLLLDDNGVPGMDAYLAALNAHENFEIRLFNPATIRSPKGLGYLIDGLRMNRRMHNKSFTVDGITTVIGGRNIGNEYFQIGQNNFFIDMDVLAAGPIVGDTLNSFDSYWNARSVFEVESIISGDGDMEAFRTAADTARADEDVQPVINTSRSSLAAFLDGRATMEWTEVRLLADDPVKGLGKATDEQLMISGMTEILRGAERSLDVVSAYFVPGKKGTELFSSLAEDGREVSILTNALNTTDHLVVHSGYTKYRRDLLSSGVHLYELKLRGQMLEADFNPHPFGLSGAALHAKTFAIDEDRIFIGSFNFDPRSVRLNCEMGFLINSPTMAQQLRDIFEGPLPFVSYQPGLTPREKMFWREPIEGQELPEIYQEEPGTSWVKQITLVVLGILPIEWLL